MKLAKKLLAVATLAALSTPAFAEITIDVIGGSEVSFEGLVQSDGNWFDNDVLDLNGAGVGTGADGKDSEFALRRAELILKGKGPGMWNWVLGYDARADKFLDANIGYKFSEFTVLTVGQYKQPNSLEELSSTKNNDFISKSMTTNMQGIARRVGVQLATGGSNLGIAGSVFDRELTRNQAGSLGNGQGYGARGYFAPVNESGNFLHLGLSYIDVEASDVTAEGRAQLRVRPDADQATVRLISTPVMVDADRLKTTGLEAAWINGPVKVQAEWMSTDITRSANPDFTADSYYVYGVYNVTGETWGYKNGVVSTGLPENPTGGLWQLGLRYDHADLNDGAVFGGEESNWTVGVNWYLRSNFKLSANYVMVDSEKRANATAPLIQDNPNILEARVQFFW